MKNKKIIFIGCVEFSKLILEELIKKKKNLIGVCAKKQSIINSDFFDLSKIAKKKNIPFIYWNRKKDEKKVFNWLKEKKPDYIFCIGWPYIIKKKFLKISNDYFIGFHPSDLPYNRGRHPLIWSIILNFKFIASTFFVMSKYADNGLILSKKKIYLTKKENSQSLYSKLFKTAKNQIPNLLKKINKNKNLKNTNLLIQKNNRKGNLFRKRTYDDGVIDWRMSAHSIDSTVRALAKPYPGAVFYYKNKEIKIWKTKIIKTKRKFEPGKILNVIGKIIIQAGDNLIQLVEFEPKIKLKKGEYL